MNKKITLNAFSLRIPFRIKFKHASAERKSTSTIWVEISDGLIKGLGESCPRLYVTGETVESALAWIARNEGPILSQCDSVEHLKEWISRHENIIDKNPSAWCAVELALLDFLAKKNNKTVESLLDLDDCAGAYQYTAVVGDDSNENTRQTINAYLSMGFDDYKIKLNGDLKKDIEKIQLFKELVINKNSAEARGKKRHLRLDANNLWGDDLSLAQDYIKKLDFPFMGIEEPLSVGKANSLSQLSQNLNIPIILDESLCNTKDINAYADLPGKWIANIRVSKMGGLIRSLQLSQTLKHLNWKIIIGSQVGETSLLTRAALPVAGSAGDHLLAQEGAFGTLLLETDPVKPLLMFKKNGILNYKPGTDLEMGFGMHLDSQLSDYRE